MPVLVRSQNQWGATGAVVGGGSTGGGGTGGTGGTTSTAGTLARPFSANSAWNRPLPAANDSSWFDYPQLRNRGGWWINDGSTGGTMSVYDVPVGGGITITVTPSQGYRGWPGGSFQWKGVAGMVNGGGSDAILTCILTASDGHRYALDMWQATGSGSTWSCNAWGVECLDGVAGNVPGFTGPGGGAIFCSGNGWGDYAVGNWNSKQTAGVTAPGAPWYGGTITSWAVSAGKFDFALSCALQPADIKGGAITANRVRPAKLPYGGGSGQVMMGHRIGFPGAPSSIWSGLSGVPRWLADAVMTYGIYVRDGAGGNVPIIYFARDVSTQWRSQCLSLMNALMPYCRVTAGGLDSTVSPLT